MSPGASARGTQGFSIFKASDHVTLTSAYIVASSSLTLLPPSFPHVDPRGYIDNPGKSPHLGILNLIRPAKPLSPRKVTDSQVPGIRMWTF